MTTIDRNRYQTMYQQSLTDNEGFWRQQAKHYIDFATPFETVFSGDFQHGEWFKEARLNVCYQCVDRHLVDKAEQTAIIWESDDGRESKTISYQALHRAVCKMANVLKQLGIKKGDRVCIYLPMIPEAAISMLACARIGAVHSVVFAGFSPQALNQRINDAGCKLLISTEQSIRGGKTTPLGEKVAAAIENADCLESVLMVEGKANYNKPCFNLSEALNQVSDECPIEMVAAEDPLFILYTSGSTGKPKGLLHTSAGYILYAAMTHKIIFDYQPGDIYWCAADIGWVTGHSYIVYGPLANGATTLMFQGTPTYPTPARFWQVVDKYQVNILYTAPTAIRALMREGNQWLETTNRKSLRLLGSVGEPINPEVWRWYHDVVGQGLCPIVDTWWQTETGGIMISPLPAWGHQKPGIAQTPFFGIEPVLVNEAGQEIADHQGLLAFKRPWPGLARTIVGDKARYAGYFINNVYIAGDNAIKDRDGDYQIIGRSDDVLNVSGHRLGSAEIENALCEHHAVAEAAVVGQQHAIKGEALYAFVTLKSNAVPCDALKKDLNETVRTIIGPIASLQQIQWAKELPKTRSGKIMRRVLRKIANDDFDHFGDLSTLAVPDVVSKLIEERTTMATS